MSTNYTSTIVRVWKGEQQKLVGAGFLAAHKYVVTCVHVVQDALGVARNTDAMPSESVTLDLPLVSPPSSCLAQIVYWNTQLDLAVLELMTLPDEVIQPASLTAHVTEELFAQPVYALGFPKGYNNGVWAEGKLLGLQANGWVQINDTQQHGYFIQPGFSGAPVWDVQRTSVVGMVIAADKGTRVGFMVPLALVKVSFPQLFATPGQPVPSYSRVAQVRRRTREQRLEQLTIDLIAENERLSATPPGAQSEQIKRGIAQIEQEMQKVEDELAAIQ
jgi:S1-C subfamily serine protease